MSIDAELILRQARQIHGLEIGSQRAAEIAEETHALIHNAEAAGLSACFEADPLRFLALLSELRDKLP